MIYSTAVILAAIAFSLKYAEPRTNKNWQKFSAAVSITSTLSFGIYLTQMAPIIILKRILQAINTHITSWEMLLLVPIGILFVCAGSWLISYFCYKVPPLGILIGRPNGKKTSIFKKIRIFSVNSRFFAYLIYRGGKFIILFPLLYLYHFSIYTLSL